jgi:hypothetical protein
MIRQLAEASACNPIAFVSAAVSVRMQQNLISWNEFARIDFRGWSRSGPGCKRQLIKPTELYVGLILNCQDVWKLLCLVLCLVKQAWMAANLFLQTWTFPWFGMCGLQDVVYRWVGIFLAKCFLFTIPFNIAINSFRCFCVYFVFIKSLLTSSIAAVWKFDAMSVRWCFLIKVTKFPSSHKN